MILHYKNAHILTLLLQSSYTQVILKIRARPIYRHADMYIGPYDDVADVSYRQNYADVYWQYLLINVLRCCSTWGVRNPKLLLRL